MKDQGFPPISRLSYHKIFNRSTQVGAGVSIFFKFFALLKRVESCIDSNKIITILFAALLASKTGFLILKRTS